LETHLKKMKPAFSVVIPTFNRARTLRSTLDSVIAQTFGDFEVLVMDDGSNDGTEEVVRSYGDPRIRYEWASNSGGPATPRNRGIEAARADWICFLDADDRWHEGKLKTVSEVIAAIPALDLVCHHEILSILATGSKIQLKHGPFETDFYRVMLMLGNRVSTSAVSVRRDFLNKHGLRFNQSPDYVIVEDYDLWLRVALHDGAFYFISEYLGEYVIADDNLSSNSERIQRNHLVLLHDHVYKVQSFQPDKDRLWREIKAGLLITKSKQLFAKKQFVVGAKSLVLAFCGSFVGSIRYICLQTSKKRFASKPRTNRDYKRSSLCRSR
jgi:glycosyltransferase involved in cell wall biosynthesis